MSTESLTARITGTDTPVANGDTACAEFRWAEYLTPLESAGQPDTDTRTDWMVALRDALHADPDVLRRDDAADWRESLFQIALVCDDLILVARLGAARMARAESSINDDTDLMLALWRLGRNEDAFDLSRRLLLGHRHAPQLESLHRDLLAWQRVDWPLPFPTGGWDDGELRLEPLGHQHLTDFVWAYADPDIAERCCLPRFQSDAHWHQWLDANHAYGDQMTFAVHHHEWGFIGSVCMVMADDIGFFYYWIARDFQGLGLGPRAADLLFELAEQNWGMRVCYAKCFVDNLPSRKAMTKLGFESLSIAIQTRRGNEMHLRRISPGQAPNPDLPEELRFVFERMDSTSTVLELALPRHSARSS